jgi:hypothetical protein
VKTRQRSDPHRAVRAVEDFADGVDVLLVVELVDAVAVGASAGALGHDGPEVVVLGGGLEHHLATHREADPADVVRIDVGARLEVVDRGLHVAVAVPSEDVRLAVALALAAAIEHEHAVALAHEHARGPLRALAAGERDHGRAVLRRDVPALQREPVAGLERDVLVRRSELVLGHHRAGRVGRHVGEADRKDEHICRHHARDRKQATAAVAPGEPAVGAARAPEGGGPDADQDQARGDGEKAGEVVAGGAHLVRVVDRLDSRSDAERRDEESEGALPAAAQAREGPRGEREQRDRKESAHGVVAGGSTGLGLEEVVVRDVERDHADRGSEQVG